MTALLTLLLTIVCLLSRVESRENNCPVRCVCSDKQLSCVSQNLSTLPDVTTWWYYGYDPYYGGHGHHQVMAETLLLDHNSISVLNATDLDKPQLRQLKLLSLAHNRISTINGTFKGLDKLERLQLDHNQLTEFDIDLLLGKNCPKLSHLQLDNNQIYHFKMTANFSSLKILNLEHNHLQSIELNANSAVKVLMLHDNYLHRLPSSVAELTQLEKITLNSNLWECRCDMAFVLNLTAAFSSPDHVPHCSKPTRLFYRRWNSLQYNEMCEPLVNYTGETVDGLIRATVGQSMVAMKCLVENSEEIVWTVQNKISTFSLKYPLTSNLPLRPKFKYQLDQHPTENELESSPSQMSVFKIFDLDTDDSGTVTCSAYNLGMVNNKTFELAVGVELSEARSDQNSQSSPNSDDGSAPSLLRLTVNFLLVSILIFLLVAFACLMKKFREPFEAIVGYEHQQHQAIVEADEAKVDGCEGA